MTIYNSRIKDLSGQRFGNLVVVSLGETRVARCGKKITQWNCICDCGTPTVVSSQHLINGKTKSCGCIRKKMMADKQYKHGDYGSKLYHVWSTMKDRCSNPNCDSYIHYGARGITYTNEWGDYSNFQRWALATGYKDGLTIDRIDPNGNYSPDNCRWADHITQANNKRNNHIISLNGESHTQAEWDRIKGFRVGTVSQRLFRGWTEYDAINTPVKRT